jgi:hypothetical protein
VKKRIQKAEFKLPFTTRLLLAFGLSPKKLEEARHVFKTAEHSLDSGLQVWIKRKFHGKIRTYSPVWIRTFKAWVRACDVRKEELKGAFFSALKYSFFVPGKEDKGDSPLLQVVVEAWLAALQPNLHTDDHETLWDLACGNWRNSPRSEWQQAALIMWLEISFNHPNNYNQGIRLCVPGTEPHRRYVLGRRYGGFVNE